jgi:predicted flavoprotein YhiN
VERFDAIVIGAGAAGMFCAAQAGQAGLRVLLLDNGKKPGRKILMSGGGRCNFTNLYVEPAAYLSQNPHFCKSALPVIPSGTLLTWWASTDRLA